MPIDNLTKSLAPPDELVHPIITSHEQHITLTCMPPRLRYILSTNLTNMTLDTQIIPNHTIPSLDTTTAITITTHSTVWLSINSLFSPIVHHLSYSMTIYPPIVHCQCILMELLFLAHTPFIIQWCCYFLTPSIIRCLSVLNWCTTHPSQGGCHLSWLWLHNSTQMASIHS